MPLKCMSCQAPVKEYAAPDITGGGLCDKCYATFRYAECVTVGGYRMTREQFDEWERRHGAYDVCEGWVIPPDVM